MINYGELLELSLYWGLDKIVVIPQDQAPSHYCSRRHYAALHTSTVHCTVQSAGANWCTRHHG